MDRFLSQKYCDRCGGSLDKGIIMSMYSMDCICLKCKDRETKQSNYHEAVETDHREIKKGNYNYKGIKG